MPSLARSGNGPYFLYGEMFTLQKKGYNEIVVTLDFAGTPRRIRTFDLRIRSPTLYPAELWAQDINMAERGGFEPPVHLFGRTIA